MVAAAQHTPPHGAYLSTGPVEAMHLIARTLRELRPALPGVGGISDASREFATEWARLGGGPAGAAMGEALYAADAVTIPSGVAGRLRQATHGDAPLLRVWGDEFVAEAGVTAAPGDAIGRRIDAGSLFVWEVDGDGGVDGRGHGSAGRRQPRPAGLHPAPAPRAGIRERLRGFADRA